jgi:hypothetical protein
VEQERPVIPDHAPPAGVQPSGKNSRLWLLIALTAVLLLALPNIRYPIGRDQATYSVIAQGLLKGKQLYRDLWDNKPPGIFYIYTVFVTIFGRAMWFVGLLDVLYLLVIGYCIFRFAERYLGAEAGAIAAVLYAVWHERGDYADAAQPETFILLLIFAAWFLLIARGRFPRFRHAAAGVLLGLAFWTKYNAGIFLVLLVFLPYLDCSRMDQNPRGLRLTIPWRPWLGRAAILAGGFVATVALGLAYFRLAGTWAALKQVQFEVLPRYAAMAYEHTPYYFLWALGQISANLKPGVEAAAAAALAVAWWRRELAKLTPVLLAAAAGFIATASQLRMHSYYFEVCFPFFAMLYAYLPVKLFHAIRALAAKFAARKMTLARVLLWLVFAELIYFPLPHPFLSWMAGVRGTISWMRNPDKSYADYWRAHPVEHLAGQIEVIRYMRAHSEPADKIYIWGTAPLIYYMTGCEPATRFISNLGPISAWAPPEWRAQLVRQLEKASPRYLIVVRHDALPTITYTELDSQEYLVEYPALANVLAAQYQPVLRLQDFVVYRRIPASIAREKS